MRGQSQQVMLDSYFGTLAEDGDWQRLVSARGFAKARERLSWSALARLNTFVVDCADKLGLVPRWQGLRVVAADSSALMPAVRPCFTSRRLADAEQRLFTLYLPGAELTLHASVHAVSVSERQMLFEALECLRPDDVLVLDRGYPAAWLVAHLTEQKIRFCMRCDKGNGWTGMRTLMRSGQTEAIVTLGKPCRQDAVDYVCAGTPTQVRLVRMVTPDGQIRVVATNLPVEDYPCEVFAELYHQRWRIEESFKRLKHRAKLESVSGLTQHALLVDVYSKVLGDNLGSLVCQGASKQADLPAKQRHCNRAYAAPCLQRLLPRMVLGLGRLATLLEKAIALLAANYHRHVPNRNQPRPLRHVKPHPSLAYKG
jgi:Transposase DDE domain